MESALRREDGDIVIVLVAKHDEIGLALFGPKNRQMIPPIADELRLCVRVSDYKNKNLNDRHRMSC